MIRPLGNFVLMMAQRYPLLGMADIHVTGNGREAEVRCFVVSDEKLPLFGQDVIAQLQLVSLPMLDVANVVKTSPVTIRVDPDAVPVASLCRCHAFAVRDEIAAELDRLQEGDVITPVKTPTPWVSPIVPARKANGKLRLCVDFRKLNEHMVHERRQIPTMEEITAQIHGSAVFTVLDAESGFHQLELDEESSHFTTFITHKGLYRFKRLPFGIASAPETFQCVLSDLLEGLDGVFVYIDDILVVGEDQDVHDKRLQLVLERLTAANLRLNWSKSQVRKPSVTYLGCVLDATGVHHDPGKATAIRDMPPPTNIKDVRRLLGMLTYLGRFFPNLAGMTEPLRRLVKAEPLVITDELLAEFKKCQDAAATDLTSLAYFDVSLHRATAVSCDASPVGLGAILWQKADDRQWQPVSCASRCLTAVESRYSQLEREMLALVFGLVKFQQYVIGRRVAVFTDHKPLVSIIHKPFDSVPARVQRWLLSLLPFDFTLSYSPGHTMCATDALSRSPLASTEAAPAETCSMREFVGLVLAESLVSESDLCNATPDDPILSGIVRRVTTGYWNDPSVAEEPYFLVRHSLTVLEGILMMDGRFAIPATLQMAVLKLAHEGHPGVSTFQESLRRLVWWPHLTRDASHFASSCDQCWRNRVQSHQELQPTEIVPVWHKVAVDLVEIEGRHLLSLVDYGSRFPELIPLCGTTSRHVILAISDVFARNGFPKELVSDNGPSICFSGIY